MALSRTPHEAGVAATPDVPMVWCVVMDIGLSNGTATVLSTAKGSASIYLSAGGAILGGEGHSRVRVAATHFVRQADQYVQTMTETNSFPLPAAGEVNFYLLLPSSVAAAQAQQSELSGRRHTLSPLFYSGQRVISELRLIAENSAGIL
jgi:hypothetical protein